MNMKVMKMIIFAESMEERPIDRDYNAHGGNRITQPEVLGGYCVLCENSISWAGNNFV